MNATERIMMSSIRDWSIDYISWLPNDDDLIFLDEKSIVHIYCTKTKVLITDRGFSSISFAVLVTLL